MGPLILVWMDIFFLCAWWRCGTETCMLWWMWRGTREADLLLCERVQQKAPMVPMRTMRATKAPTAMPMITATGSDSAETATQRERERESVL